jgi:hypothetical protein
MKAALALAAALMTSPALAQTSEEYAFIGAKAYGAWSCSILAAHASNRGDADRLFNLGYGLGKTFLEAVKSGKITPQDLGKYPQIMFLDLLLPSVSNIEFDLGVMYGEVRKRVTEQVWKDTESAELRGARARAMYLKQNCSFL